MKSAELAASEVENSSFLHSSFCILP
jgi:hypothetical protein